MDDMTGQLVIAGRVAIAAALGLLVGFEREFHGKEAGERTFALVALGSCTFAALAGEVFPETGGQLLAGVATGVGFLGIGIIWRHEGGQARGLTTAAGIWGTAAAAALIGLGRLAAGLLVVAILLAILEFDRLPLIRAWHRRVIARDERSGRPDHRPGDEPGGKPGPSSPA